MKYTTSQEGLELIASFEGCELTAYRCPAGVLTIGYGHTGDDVYEGQEITEDEAFELLAQDVKTAENCVNAQNLEIEQHQFDALVSFVYNVGSGNFKKSTLLRKVRENAMDESIRDEFMKWVQAGGKILDGLVARRNAEADLYFLE